MRSILSVVVLISSLTLTGCQSIGYYSQSIKGQWQVVYRSKPIDTWLKEETTPIELKEKLKQVKLIRQFASSELNLPDNKSYTKYADIERDNVVWNIFAAPELSLQPYTWCYPIIGCQAYRGYFSKQPAIDLAKKIKANGYDVSVGGVKAYSTLGWFNDPVLNTFINYSQTNLASLIFHELSHQIVYVKDDTVFNESFATMVENKGVEIWLKHHNQDQELFRYQQTQLFENEILTLITYYKDKLDELYKNEINEQDKRDKKLMLFAQLKQEYEQLRKSFHFTSAWDNWFSQALNNAHLVAIGTYYDKVAEFEQLFVKSNRDFATFFLAVKKLAKLSKDEREVFFTNLDNS